MCIRAQRRAASWYVHHRIIMREAVVAPTSPDRSFRAVPEIYVGQLAQHVRSLALDGRGDDARGRHLASLYALEWAYRYGWFDYRPTRDPGRWALLLIDVVGARAGLSPLERLTSPVDAFLARTANVGLERVAARTREALVAGVAKTYDLPVGLASPLVGRMSLAAALWVLGVPSTGTTGCEKHPQGRQVRKVLRARIDAIWDRQLEALEMRGSIDAETVFAAIPASYRVTARAVRAALVRVGEDLAHVPFAVFYALLTDARRGGRVWRPPDRFVEGGSYDRAAFEAMVGHVLTTSRSRKRRDQRSSALAELGLSASFPRTFVRIDRWLELGDIPELCLARGGVTYPHCDWFSWSQQRSDRIERRHMALVEGIADANRDQGR